MLVLPMFFLKVAIFPPRSASGKDDSVVAPQQSRSREVAASPGGGGFVVDCLVLDMIFHHIGATDG